MENAICVTRLCSSTGERTGLRSASQLFQYVLSFLMRETALPLFASSNVLLLKLNSSDGGRVDFRTTAASSSEASESGGSLVKQSRDPCQNKSSRVQNQHMQSNLGRER
jgi:hypothetical protein